MFKLPLMFLATLPATAATAQVCNTVAPGWSGQPVGLLGQLIFMVSGPYMVVPFILLGLAILSPWYRLKAALGVAFMALAGLYVFDWFWPLMDASALARIEGCQGNPLLFIVLLAGMGVLVILRAFAQRAAL